MFLTTLRSITLMAKLTKVTPNRKFEQASTGKILACHTLFVYIYEVYKSSPGYFNLEDSKTIQSATYIKDSVDRQTKGKTTFRITTTLIAAPEKWLLENNYKEIKQDV